MNRILNAIFAGLKLVGRAFGNLLKSEAMKWCAAHKHLAVDIILEVAGSALAGPEKRAEAFRRIAAALKAEGIEFKNHFINLLIELVVAELKAKSQIP